MPGWGSERGSAAAAASRGRGKGQGCCSADPCSAGAAARVHGTQGTAGGASSKAKAKLGSVSNGDKVTVTVACLGGVGGRNLLRALFANPVKKGVEIGGWVPGVGRCSVPSPLHPSPEQLRRMLRCPGWGSSSSPHPRGLRLICGCGAFAPLFT